MARRDGSGPLGQGALTGRGFGACNQENTFNNFRCGQGSGRGMEMKMGRRAGLGRGFGYYEASMQRPKDLLQEEKEMLKKRLDFINQELETL